MKQATAKEQAEAYALKVPIYFSAGAFEHDRSWDGPPVSDGCSPVLCGDTEHGNGGISLPGGGDASRHIPIFEGLGPHNCWSSEGCGAVLYLEGDRLFVPGQLMVEGGRERMCGGPGAMAEEMEWPLGTSTHTHTRHTHTHKHEKMMAKLPTCAHFLSRL